MNPIRHIRRIAAALAGLAGALLAFAMAAPAAFATMPPGGGAAGHTRAAGLLPLLARMLAPVG